MIHFDKTDEPENFDADVRRSGLRWLEDHPDAGRPKDYWNKVKPDLAKAFGRLCAYSCMYEPVGTVDHYLSCSACLKRDEGYRVYEWDNYRFASGWINSSKQNADDTVLDPFEVEDGWFEILLPSLELIASDCAPNSLRPKAEYTLTRLHLRNDQRVIRQRQEWYRMYRDGEITLEGLRKKAPLLARAVDSHAGGQGVPR